MKKQSEQLSIVLTNNGLKPKGKKGLFQWIQLSEAKNTHHFIAQQGILTRLFSESLSLRFGLPQNELQLSILDKTLARLALNH